MTKCLSCLTSSSISLRSLSENGKRVSGSEKSPLARIKSTRDSILKTMALPTRHRRGYIGQGRRIKKYWWYKTTDIRDFLEIKLQEMSFLPFGRTNFQVWRFLIGANMIGSILFNLLWVFAFLLLWTDEEDWFSLSVGRSSSRWRLFFVSHILFLRDSARSNRSMLNDSWIFLNNMAFGRDSYSGMAASRAKLKIISEE